jgi:hypothetical protein
MASASILRATYGTKLWTRMRENKRLWRLPDRDSFSEALQVDILPTGDLSRAALIEGRIYLNNCFANVERLCQRLRGWIDLVQRVPQGASSQEFGLDDAILLIRNYEAMAFAPLELRTIGETLEYTRDKCPVMLARVADAVLNQLRWDRLRTFHSKDQLEQVLSMERAGELLPDTTPVVLPSAFGAAFRKRLFPEVYERLYRNLPDADGIPDAASEVFVDFLVRLGDESAGMAVTDFIGPRQTVFLRQLCDRTAARLSNRPPEEFVADEMIDRSPLKGLKKSGIYDAVLKQVGDRLRELSP